MRYTYRGRVFKLSSIFKLLVLVLLGLPVGFSCLADQLNVYADNCGFSCAAGACLRLRGHVEEDCLRCLLRLDPFLQRPASFADIKRALAAYELDCVGYEDVTLKEVYENTSSDKIAIMHIGDENVNHYILVNRVKEDTLRVDNFPDIAHIYTVAEYEGVFGSKITGKVLFVSRMANQPKTKEAVAADSSNNGKQSAPVPKPEVSETHLLINGNKIEKMPTVWLAPREKDPRVLEGTLVIENLSSLPLKIKDIKGSCSCFSGWEGSDNITANASGRIKLKVNRDRVSETNGEAFRALAAVETSQMTFQVELILKPTVFQVFAIPAEIDFGIVSREELLHKVWNVDLVRRSNADKVTVGSASFDDKIVSVEEIPTEPNPSREKITLKRLQVRIKSADDREIDTLIRVDASQTQLPEQLQIRVRGRVEEGR